MALRKKTFTVLLRHAEYTKTAVSSQGDYSEGDEGPNLNNTFYILFIGIMVYFFFF